MIKTELLWLTLCFLNDDYVSEVHDYFTDRDVFQYSTMTDVLMWKLSKYSIFGIKLSTFCDKFSSVIEKETTMFLPNVSISVKNKILKIEVWK